MDETLLHAATLEDIYDNQIYGLDARPTFKTWFIDENLKIEIGVFLRPGCIEALKQLKEYYQIGVFTASEEVYADAILDKVDPTKTLFNCRLYRSKCTRTSLNLNPQQLQQNEQNNKDDYLSQEKVFYIKDLRCIRGFNLSEITLVDNSLLSFALQP